MIFEITLLACGNSSCLQNLLLKLSTRNIQNSFHMKYLPVAKLILISKRTIQYQQMSGTSNF